MPIARVQGAIGISAETLFGTIVKCGEKWGGGATCTSADLLGEWQANVTLGFFSRQTALSHSAERTPGPFRVPHPYVVVALCAAAQRCVGPFGFFSFSISLGRCRVCPMMIRSIARTLESERLPLAAADRKVVMSLTRCWIGSLENRVAYCMRSVRYYSSIWEERRLESHRNP
jgi:hypothetical protein